MQLDAFVFLGKCLQYRRYVGLIGAVVGNAKLPVGVELVLYRAQHGFEHGLGGVVCRDNDGDGDGGTSVSDAFKDVRPDCVCEGVAVVAPAVGCDAVAQP